MLAFEFLDRGRSRSRLCRCRLIPDPFAFGLRMLGKKNIIAVTAVNCIPRQFRLNPAFIGNRDRQPPRQRSDESDIGEVALICDHPGYRINIGCPYLCNIDMVILEILQCVGCGTRPILRVMRTVRVGYDQSITVCSLNTQARKRLIDLVITFPPLYQTNNDKQQISFSGKVRVKPFSSIYNTRNTTL